MNCKTCNTPEPIYLLKDGQCFGCTHKELVAMKASMESNEQAASATLYPSLAQCLSDPANTLPGEPSPCKA